MPRDLGLIARISTNAAFEAELREHMRQGGSPDVRSHYSEVDNTILMEACLAGRIVNTRLLLHLGANPNLKNSEGCTALMIACIRGTVNNVEELLIHGANPNLKDNDGFTALMHVAYRGINRIKIAQLLVRGGANIKATCRGNRDAIYYAKRAMLDNNASFIDIYTYLKELNNIYSELPAELYNKINKY